MNRSNVGNIGTNGMQILSVGATTASGALQGFSSMKRRLDDASSFLNNTTKQEREDIKAASARRQVDDAKRYLAGGSSPYQHMTDEEASNYQEEVAKSKKAFKFEDKSKDEELSVDELMDNSEQIKPLKQSISNNIEWLKGWISDKEKEQPKNEIIKNQEQEEKPKTSLGGRHKKRRRR